MRSSTRSDRLVSARSWRCALLLVLLVADVAAAQIVSGSQIKAAFLYNFTRFVEWPEHAFGNRADPIVIGVLGDESIVTDLRALVAGRKVNGRSIAVRSVATADEAADAQVLFVATGATLPIAELAAALAHRPVLTVGEAPGFADAGGAIQLVEQSGKLRFEINMAAAGRANVKVSSELQKLATAVRHAP